MRRYAMWWRRLSRSGSHPMRVSRCGSCMPAVRMRWCGLPDCSAAETVLRQMVEEDLYRPSYLRLVRMALFLLIELLMLVIYGVIASVGGNFEEQMHVRRGNHLLAVPAGLIEAACLLLIFTVAVRLVVMLTDNEMLLFNQETIDHTIFFRYLYRI